MRLDLQHDYDCDADTLLSVIRTEDYTRQKYEGLGKGPVELIEFGETGSRFRTKVERQLPGISPGSVPRIARRFVHESYTLILTEEWELSERTEKHGTLALHIRDVPVKMEGSLRLQPVGSGCRKIFDCEIKSSIPIVGRKVEQEGDKMLRRALEKEHAFTLEYLREHA